jgi:hypothetical protein
LSVFVNVFAGVFAEDFAGTCVQGRVLLAPLPVLGLQDAHALLLMTSPTCEDGIYSGRFTQK